MFGDRLSDVTASPRSLPSRTVGRMLPYFGKSLVRARSRPPASSSWPKATSGATRRMRVTFSTHPRSPEADVNTTRCVPGPGCAQFSINHLGGMQSIDVSSVIPSAETYFRITDPRREPLFWRRFWYPTTRRLERPSHHTRARGRAGRSGPSVPPAPCHR
jgi:hypothetical protein